MTQKTWINNERLLMVSCTQWMLVVRSMFPVETIPEVGGEGDRKEWWRGWIQLWYIVRTFVNVTMYHSTTINIIIKKSKLPRLNCLCVTVFLMKYNCNLTIYAKLTRLSDNHDTDDSLKKVKSITSLNHSRVVGL
jgi:hypothetical protein